MIEINKKGVVTTITAPLVRKKDWEFWVLVSGDRHLDNPKSDRRLAIKHLEQLKERNGLLIDIGDLFCVMQGKFDPRSYKPDVLEENRVGDYLGSVVRAAVDFFAPYKDNIAVIGTGNHESAILKRSEFDLTQALVDRLNDKGSPCVNGGYRGWIKFKFTDGNTRLPINFYYTHGSGGGGPVTRGVINTNRMAAYLSNADIVASGHIHESWQVIVPRIELTQNGEERQREQLHFVTATYKQEFTGSGGGYHHEKGRPPKPLGAQWLRFYFADDQVKYETMRAA